MNVFNIEKIWTMAVQGGNTSDYQGDGRRVMARQLERLWPGVVTTTRRYQRPQHHVIDNWRRFDTPLKLKPGVDLSKIEPNDYGLKPTVKGEIRNQVFKAKVDQALGK